MRTILSMMAALACAPAATAADAPKKPNVLFVAVDDLRPALACAGAAGREPSIVAIVATMMTSLPNLRIAPVSLR